MALTPIAPPSFAATPTVAAPPPPAAAVVVTPTTKSTDANASQPQEQRSTIVASVTPANKPEVDPKNAYLDRALDELNQHMRAWDTNLHFEVDPDINQIIVSVIDSENGEVLRTIPTDAVIHAAKMLVKMQGLAIETTA